MKKLLIIGPIPPPIHGESLAIKLVRESQDIKRNFCITTINTNRVNVTKAGKFSIKKITQDILIIIKVIIKIIIERQDVSYISISQTKLGLLRDLIIIYVCSLRSQKVITHLHGNNLGNVINSMNVFQRNIVKKVFSRIDTGIVLGESLIDNFKGYTQNTAVVSNGIDINYIQYDKLNFSIEEHDTIELVYLSNLIHTKGYVELINAAIELIEEGANIRLRLAGSIFDKEEFEIIWDKVKKSNLEANIQYLGIVNGDMKRELLLKSHIMILPTNYPIEGQPLSIIEGMAAGLAIISTKRGSIPDLVKDNGILIEDGKSSLVKAALFNLIEDKKKIEKMRFESRQLFMKKFTLKQHISEILKIFNS